MKLKKTGVRLLAFTALAVAFAATARAGEIPPAAEEMAKTYGLDSWGQIEGIRYTWNAEVPGAVKPFDGGAGTILISHTWEWDPKTGTISYEGKDNTGQPLKVTYQRSQLSSQSDVVKNFVDAAFFNDQYWLLIPLHAVWDTSAKVTDEGQQKPALEDSPADLVAVKYSGNDGYTPGDTWDLYADANHRIEEMDYHRGGPKKPSLVVVSWTGYKKAGPLLVSTEHRGTADGAPLHLFFTNVSVKVTGSDNWVNAE
ncbi:MAG: hypothetical protein JOZ08_05200 [Verrucomicrobia bacterium]|nr:hypothetical protein [Verrucomicrobiota bacterium]MBV8279829.1 hypothetical protein [Verrucomicrobiota bacterium]